MKIDFGSGYNPEKGYLTCDMTYSPALDYVYDIQSNEILYCEENSVTEFRLKNVLHHCKNIQRISECLYRYLKENGVVRIIEPRPEKYDSNRSLDIFWYRYIYPRYEIFIPPVKRVDYVSIFSGKFEIVSHDTDENYDYYVFHKK